MDGRLIFRHHMGRFDAGCDAVWKVSGPLDVAVPQGRGHIRSRSHRIDGQEKPAGQPAGDAASGSWGQQERQQTFQGVTKSMRSGSVVETRTVAKREALETSDTLRHSLSAPLVGACNWQLCLRHRKGSRRFMM
jgi:hypothetical protein